ncbi:MAG: DUF134 domain-containing protein [Halobacteriota archaeon]|nr:DUF134 domain-containing protein [Halobacteriota archaeon]
MPRPTKCRRIHFEPEIMYFKPAGIPLTKLGEVILTLEEFESIRLKDLEGMTQDEASKVMDISQPTFHRLLTSARRKVAEALVLGKAIRVDGGNYKMVMAGERIFRCFDCENEWGEPYGTGRPEKCPVCESVNINRSPEDRGPGKGRGHKGREKRGVQV